MSQGLEHNYALTRDCICIISLIRSYYLKLYRRRTHPSTYFIVGWNLVKKVQFRKKTRMCTVCPPKRLNKINNISALFSIFSPICNILLSNFCLHCVCDCVVVIRVFLIHFFFPLMNRSAHNIIWWKIRVITSCCCSSTTGWTSWRLG